MNKKKGDSKDRFTEEYYKKKIKERFNKTNKVESNLNIKEHELNKGNPSYEIDDDDDENVFDKEGNINTDNSKVYSDIKKSLEPVITNILKMMEYVLSVIEHIFYIFSNRIYKLFLFILDSISAILIPIIKLINNSIFSKNKKNINPVIKKEKPKNMIIGSFNDIIDLNILFFDNNNKPLYKIKSEILTKTEEKFILERAISEIKDLTLDTNEYEENIDEGIYEGLNIPEIIYNLEEYDIKIYLGFIKTNFDVYSNKKYKISDNFIKWLSLGAPVEHEK